MADRKDIVPGLTVAPESLGDDFYSKLVQGLQSARAAIDPTPISSGVGWRGQIGGNLGLAMSMLPPGAKMEAPVAGATKGIRAFHGSPYDFEKFDISKIGTGEGAQAYGHGLYFAEAEPTAQSYKTATSDLKDWGVSGNPDWRLPSWVGKQIRSSPKAGLDMAIQDFEGRLAEMKAEKHWNVGGIQDIVDALHSIKEGKSTLVPPGKMYEVSINADPEHFLDWDKPLSEQHPKVKEALAPVADKRGSYVRTGDWSTSYGTPKTAGEALQALELDLHKPGKGHLDRAAVSDYLRQAGIPGIKYLDQGSRAQAFRVDLSTSKGPYTSNTFASRQQAEQFAADKAKEGFKTNISDQGTHNYVVFDDKTIEILRKYGIAGLAILPPAVAQEVLKQMFPEQQGKM